MNKSELLKTAKGILFSTPMVQAILEDRKKIHSCGSMNLKG